jgi:hypothetical protein
MNSLQPLNTASFDQARVFQGLSYQWDESPGSALVATTGNILVGVTTPAVGPAFQGAVLVVGASAQGQCRLTIFSGTTHTGGTGRTPVNRSRLAGTSSSVAISATPSGGADGTLLSDRVVPPNVQWFDPAPIVLAPNTKYLFRLLNLTAATNFATLSLNFVEVPRLELIQ